jgi:hypothetical protein
MALRGPARPGAKPKPTAQLSQLESSLLASGLAKTPTEARVLARTLVGSLKKAGLKTTVRGSPSQVLEGLVKAFQQANGLPVTGKLDGKTAAKMREQGVLPKDGGAAKGADAGAAKGPVSDLASKLAGAQKAGRRWGDYAAKPGAQAPREGAAKGGERGHVVSHEQTRARAELVKRAPMDLSDVLGKLANLGFFAGGRGKERMEGALRAFQQGNGLPVTAKMDAATVRELVKQGVLPEGTEVPPEKKGDGAAQTGAQNAKDSKSARERPQARAQGAAADVAARGEASANSSSSKARADTAQGNAAPDGRGVPEGQGDPAAQAGKGAQGEGAGVAGSGGEGNPNAVATGDQRGVDEGDPGGTEDDDANSASGDDDLEDARRGHATLDEESDDEAGHYEVPALAEQIREALDSIVRLDNAKGAARYAWDVTFYRPGVYGGYQAAEPLWHVVVDEATSFDPVWKQAQAALDERMREIEPASPPPTIDDFVAALRRARVRES